jgi:hypothetical protein
MLQFLTIWALFVFLLPGILITVPPIGKKIFMSGKSNFISACVHGIIFAILLSLLNLTEGFSQPLITPACSGEMAPRCPPGETRRGAVSFIDMPNGTRCELKACAPPACWSSVLPACPSGQYRGGESINITTPSGGRCNTRACIPCYTNETSCEPGKYLANVTFKPHSSCPSASGKKVCRACPKYRYCPGGTESMKACTLLDRTSGTYVNTKATSDDTCFLPCPEGSYCPGSFEIKTCPQGASCPMGTEVPEGYTMESNISGVKTLRLCDLSTEYCPRNNYGPSPIDSSGNGSSLVSEVASYVSEATGLS